MSEVFFYHLTTTSVEAALPALLEKTLERGFRALVIGEEKRITALEAHLWTYRAESFLPHGLASSPHAIEQPILLSETLTPINNADICFLLDSKAMPEDYDSFKRICILFSGEDEDELDNARAQWKLVKATSAEAAYYKQNENGGWEKK
jgi:DNA polymerase III subunit chi